MTDPFTDLERLRLPATQSPVTPRSTPVKLPTEKGAGTWLPWPIVEAAVKLRLKPSSRHQVYWALLAVACRYGGGEVRRSVEEIAAMTGLSPRTVKSAIADLTRDGHVKRLGRYCKLVVTIISTPPGPPHTPSRRPS